MELSVKCKNRLSLYCINLLSLLVFWGGVLRKSFNSDTIFHMVVDDADVMTRIEEGRYFVAFADFLLLKVGLRTTSNLSITMLFTLLIIAAAMLELQNIFEKWMPQNQRCKAGFLCGLNLTFLNVLFAETLMFGESSIYFAIAYWTAAVGVKCYTKKKYLLMLLMYGIAVSSYQNGVVFAAVVTAFYVLLDEEMVMSRRLVIREIVGVAIGMGMGVLNFLSIKFLEHLGLGISFSKEPGIGDMGQKLSKAAKYFVKLNQNGGGIFPNLWIPFLFTVFLLVLILYSCIRKHQLTKFISIVMVWCGSSVLLYVIPMLQDRFSFPPRLSFCFFLIQGLLIAAAYTVSMDSLKNLITFGGSLYLIIHLLFADFIITNHFVSNTLDEVYIKMMYEEILKYENDTGIRVTKLAVAKDAYAPDSYEEVAYATDQINERVLGTATYSLIEIMADRVFKIIEMPQPIYEKYFQGKDWDYFDLKEQLVIENDEAYWCIF